MYKLDLFEVYRKDIDDFSSVEELEGFYNKYIDYWGNRLKSIERLEAKKKCECIVSALKDIKTSQKERLVRALKEKELKSSPYYIDPIKAQAKAEVEEWLKQREYKLETGQELKQEKGKILYLHPRL